MVYIINNFNGTTLVGINDKTVNNTATDLRLPGRDYKPYGEVIVENLVWMLQNFADVTPPINPITGQVWYDSVNQEIKVWDQEWLRTGKTVAASEFPPTARLGQLFYHTSKQQLFVFDLSETWQLIAPVGSANSSDPAPAAAITYTGWQAFKVSDLVEASHNIVRISVGGSVGGSVVGVWSNDAEFTVASDAIPGFTPVTIKPGLNLQTGTQLNGLADLANTATNSLQLGGIPAATYMRLDQNNVPTTSGVNLGSVGNEFDNMYATSFVGTASNATQLAGQSASYYQNANHINAGTLALTRLPYVPVDKAGDVGVGNLTMGGTLTLATGPISGLEAATKAYVDAIAATIQVLTFVYETQVPILTPPGYSNGLGLIDPTKNYLDVFPPVGKTMDNLKGFLASISQISFNGDVDNNDTLLCRWEVQVDRIRVWVQNTEQRAAPQANYLVIWS